MQTCQAVAGIQIPVVQVHVPSTLRIYIVFVTIREQLFFIVTQGKIKYSKQIYGVFDYILYFPEGTPFSWLYEPVKYSIILL